MAARLYIYLRRSLLLVMILLCSVKMFATHIFGADLYYTNVSGNTYTVTLVMYGDCSGSAFSSLSSAAPYIKLYNGATFIDSFSLALQAPLAGLEVTPVCPADAGSTTCSDPASTIPGITKFVYSANVTLSGTSSVWRFLFKGNMGSGVAMAGRSSSITNILSPGTSTMQLVDTLNNTTAANSSPVYTTIPTPFFCLNIPANFNPGAVDPNSDSLTFYLVPGVDAAVAGPVTYISPYTAIAPLGTAAGTFLFSSTTGQLSFTPNITQKSLVVYNVEEYRSGVLVGTSQREMSFVVLGSCDNNPPVGSITSASGGTVIDSTDFSICNAAGAFTFHIDPTDADGNNITMTYAGLPTGATFTITGNGTTAPLATFSWNTTGVAPGYYTFFITYQDDGCPLSAKQTHAYTITVLPQPAEVCTIQSSATCLHKAAIHITPSGLSAPFTVTVLEGGSTIQTFSSVTTGFTDSLSPGIYTIRTTNTGGCFTDTTITIASPALPVPAVTVTAPLCTGGTNGSATITASAGLAPYTYAIGAGTYAAANTFTALSSGTYTLHIKDANGCIKDTTIVVPNPTPTLAHIAIRKPLCNTQANGEVVIAGYNSIAPYTYALASGAYSANDTFNSLAAGTYTFHIKNTNGCILDTTLSLVDSEILYASVAITNVLCYGGASGTVTLTGTGGFAPYTYAYNTNPFSATNTFTLPIGSYTIHVHDTEACYFDTTVFITQPTPLTLTAATTNVSCYGGNNGAVTITGVGGTPAYQYELNSGIYVLSSTFTALSSGTDVLHIKDANGCTQTDTITITQPTAVSINTVTFVMPTCNAGTDGSFTITASGGTSPYTYAYDAGTFAASSSISGLSSGTYTLHVKDANGCTHDTTVTLSQPAAIVPSAAVRKSVCSTLANGEVILSATGGTAGYTYAMGAGAYTTTAAFTPLAAGTYTFHIKDTHGCIKDTSITITDSLSISGTLTISPALCYDQASGSISVSGTGGTSPYTYALGAGTYASGSTFSALAAAAYTIHIKDANGCIHDTGVSVGQPSNILPSLTVTHPLCYGYADGSLSVSATGGTPAYTFAMGESAYSTSTTFSGLPATTDTILIKDANGCIHDTIVTITQPTPLAVAGLTGSNVKCNGDTSGTVTVTATGATAPYMYAANAGTFQTGNTFSGFAVGTQLIHIKDANGCTLDTSIRLTQPNALAYISADTVDPTCQGFTDGSVILLMTGGTLPYAYSDNGTTFGTNNNFTSLSEGVYNFFVTDSNHCVADTTITLTGYPHIVVDNVTITEPSCFGAANGGISLTATGGVQPLLYDISNQGEVTTSTFSNLAAISYIIEITDSKGCKKDTTVDIPQPDSLHIITALTLNDCIGLDNGGAVTVTIQGGTEPYTYLWNTTPALTTPALTGLPNGSYSVLVTDANNCIGEATADIVYNDCCKPFIPSAFTPNGDGHNDVFHIRFKGDITLLEFSIYNRFGQQVFTTTNVDEGWDGKFAGNFQDIGTYFYYVKMICGNRNDHVLELKGDVTLIR